MSDEKEFQECGICSKKPGSPVLCPSCLHNRALIDSLKNTIQGLEHDRVSSPQKSTTKFIKIINYLKAIIVYTMKVIVFLPALFFVCWMGIFSIFLQVMDYITLWIDDI